MKKKYLSLFLAIALIPVSGFAAEGLSPAEQADKLAQAALISFKAGQIEQALVLAEQARQLNPKNAASYHVLTIGFWEKRNFQNIVAIVQTAKQNGVESLILYRYMTEALYYLGGFSASLQGFKKIEDLMESGQTGRPSS